MHRFFGAVAFIVSTIGVDVSANSYVCDGVVQKALMER